MESKDRSRNCKYCNRVFSSIAQRISHESPCEQLQEYNKLFGSYSFAQEVYMCVMQTTDKLEAMLQKHNTST
jgi:hypothetical protein